MLFVKRPLSQFLNSSIVYLMSRCNKFILLFEMPNVLKKTSKYLYLSSPFFRRRILEKQRTTKMSEKCCPNGD